MAGVAALIKSAYPHWELDDIRNKLLTSVDDIYTIPEDPDLNAEHEADLELGSGRVNAYKALTFYGKVGTAEPDTTWTNDVWVSGDIEVPAGCTLRVAAGTTIHMAQDNILSKGDSANRCEFVVYGRVLMEGTETEPIVIDMHRDDGSENRFGGRLCSPATLSSRRSFVRMSSSRMRIGWPANRLSSMPTGRQLCSRTAASEKRHQRHRYERTRPGRQRGRAWVHVRRRGSFDIGSDYHGGRLYRLVLLRDNRR